MSSFWSGLLGGTVETDDDWHTIYVDGEPRMGIQLAPNHIPPQWPDETPQQIHLDLYVEDVAAAHEEAMAFGAKLVQAADDLTATMASRCTPTRPGTRSACAGADRRQPHHSLRQPDSVSPVAASGPDP